MGLSTGESHLSCARAIPSSVVGNFAGRVTFWKPPALPPGGPIHTGLNYLYQAKIISAPPSASELDDAAFEPGVIYADNGLLGELCGQKKDWSMIDVHNGIYVLGTRDSWWSTLE